MKHYVFITMFISALATISCKKESEATEAIPPQETIDAPAQAIHFVVDTTASVINWTGSKPTGSHTGTIKLKDGELFIKSDTVTSGAFTINMKTIEDNDLKDPEQKQNLENHLKGLKADAEDHFFNTTKYPIGKFEITKIVQEANKMVIHGNLTLKDSTKNISFPAAITNKDSIVTLTSEPFKIDRTLWNVNYNSKSVFNNLGNQYIDDDIELQVKVIARKEE
ncbi:YceI family protein [Flavobacterium rhizosphaerae]|uniref:YceI family protein n=1 Tax=Flavobacterium rhizosphaerae TaxID=3163298 RepID=A0ABW8YUT7_9FLAO